MSSVVFPGQRPGLTSVQRALLAAGPAVITCSGCRHDHAPAVIMTVKISRHAAKRPTTPGLAQIYPHCRAFILPLHPGAGGISEGMRTLNEGRDALKDRAAR